MSKVGLDLAGRVVLPFCITKNAEINVNILIHLIMNEKIMNKLYF